MKTPPAQARSPIGAMLLAATLLATSVVVAFAVGRFPISPGDLAEVLMARLSGRPPSVSPAIETVILGVRGPRVLAAVLIVVLLLLLKK